MSNRVPLSVVDLMPHRDGAPQSETVAETVTAAQAAERAGFTRYWIAEHHNSLGLSSSATVVVMAEVAAATSAIRVGAGGIMLPNHSPYVVAEQFGTLDAFHPGRIDLGLGRAPGTDPWTAQALRRTKEGAKDFPQEVVEILGYLGEPRPGQHVQAHPGQGSNVPVYLLGSSTYGATLAAQLGRPYVFAAHFAPQQMHEALDAYRSQFRPSAVLDEPYAIVAAGAIVAETDERARYLATSTQQRFATLARGDMRFLPPVEDLTAVTSPRERQIVDQMLSETAIGSPSTVVDALEDLQHRTDADEIMLMTETYDIADRVRSHELLGEAWNA